MGEEEAVADTNSYELTFKNGALEKLKQLAKRFDIPEENLDQVIEKGLRALELGDDDRLEFNKGGNKYFVRLKDL